jgi:hypothetical protein
MSQWPYRIAREQRAIRALIVSVSVLSLAAACYDDDNNDYNPTEPLPPQATIITASGAITAKVDEFRALLGDPRNGGTVVGPAAAGRREVNWDGVAGANLNTNTFPTDFFARTTKLGLITTTPGAPLLLDVSGWANERMDRTMRRALACGNATGPAERQRQELQLQNRMGDWQDWQDENISA